MKIGVRIFLGYFLVVGLSAWYLLYTAQKKLDPALRQSMEDTLVDTANLLAELAHDDVKAGTVANGHFAKSLEDFSARRLNADIWGIQKEAPNHRIYVTDAKGRILYDSDHLAVGQDYSRWNDVYLTLQGRYGVRTTREDPEDPGSGVMHVGAPIMDQGKVIGVVTVAKAAGAVEPFFQQAFNGLARAGAIVLLVSVLIGSLLSWWLTRALAKLLAYTAAVGRGERVALPKLGGGEVGVLGNALEAMRTQLEGKQYVENYVHSLTHELKSPLAAIRGAAELLEPDMPAADQARFVGNIRGEAARLTDIIDRLLALAQLESRSLITERVNIAAQALVDDVLTGKESQLHARQLQVRCELAAGLMLSGEPFLLRQALSNLLDNAMDFSPAGTEICICAHNAGTRNILTVRDHGPGIPDYALPRVFERFYSLARPGGVRKSTGLGLPFVKEVASLHGGEVTVVNHGDGGVLATLSLPT